MKKNVCLVVCLLVGSVQAAPTTYEGNLTNGTVFNNSTVNNNLYSSGSWDFWTFDGNAGDNIILSVLRREINHDPVMAIWFGLESDTSAYSGLFANSSNTTLVGTFDDNQADLFGGPFDDPLANVFLASTGTYTVAIADHTFGGYDCIEGCDYSIQLSGSTASVPEPASLAIIGLGLAGIGFSRKKKLVRRNRRLE